jgi:enoyl-CoA hydratase
MIEREVRDGVAVVRLAHGKASALDVELAEAIVEEIRSASASDAGAVVLTGTGSIFSAGVDLFRIVNEGAPYVRRFFPALVDAIRAIFESPKPVVAAVNGHAIAGGCILTAACDYRLMARGGGRIGIPELLVGVPFPAVALEIMRAAVAPQHLQELVYTGKTVQAEEALAKGLVDEVAEPDALAERAFAVAAQMAAIPADTFRITKRNLRRPVLDRVDTADDAKALAVWESAETHAGIRRYLERTIGKK